MLSGELLPRGRQVDFTALAPERWMPGFATPFNQRMIGGSGCCPQTKSFLQHFNQSPIHLNSQHLARSFQQQLRQRPQPRSDL